MSFKNIQRRVYDAINVMSSIGLVNKVNNAIRYVNFNKIVEKDTIQKIEEMKEEIIQKKKLLIAKLTEIHCYKILINKNKNCYCRTLTQDKLNIPFILIDDDKGNLLQIRQSQNRKNLIVFSKKEIDFMTFDEIAKKICFESRNDIVKFAGKIGGENCRDYLQRKRLIEEHFEDIIKENEDKRKERREKEKDKRKKIFDVDFNCLSNNNNNNGNNLNMSGYYLNDNDENKDNSINESTNFYSKLILI